MRLGALDTLIEIERHGEYGRDEFNTPLVGHYVLAQAMAQRVQTTGREFLAAEGVTAEERVVFRLHWLPGVTTRDRVKIPDERAEDGTQRPYNIREVRPLGRNRFLELHTVRSAP